MTPVTRYECPIGNCEWTFDDPGPVITIHDDPSFLATSYFVNLDAVMRAHLETHSLEDWAREVTRLREAATAMLDLQYLTGKAIGVTVTPYIAYGPATLLFEVLLADDEGERLADFQEQPSIAAGLAEARKWAED